MLSMLRERRSEMICNQQAVFRYTWPGRNEAVICLECAQQLKVVAEAIGLHLQLIPLSGKEQAGMTCPQTIKESHKLERKEEGNG